ncbi:MAG: extracellular solute-binding protein [Anaerolineaceae bacterium]|nr:extracellular solute-binding protein [Anaerolineaceae bacterium]
MLKRLLLVVVLLPALVTGVVGAQDEGVTVTWWTETNSMPSNIQEVLVDPFNEAHPGITLEILPQESLNETLRVAIQGGEAPDILQTPGANFISEFVDAGLVMPLDEAAAELGWEDKLLGWAFGSGQLGGQLYSIPLTYESLVLFYNKTLFDEQGWSPPTNIEEFNALADAANALGIFPTAGGNATWQGYNEIILGMYLSNVAGPDNFYRAMTGEIPWDDESIADSYELFRQHMVDGWFSGGLENFLANGGDDAPVELATGLSAMMMDGTWRFRGIDQFFVENDTVWDWAPLPTMSDRVEDYNYTLATGSTLSVNGASPNPDAAVKVLDFLLSDASRVLQLAADVGFGEWVVPIHFSADDFPEGTDERVVRFFADFAAVTGGGRIGYTTWTFWPSTVSLHSWDGLERVWYGEESVEEYLAVKQALWDEAVAEGNMLPVPAPGM